MENCPNCNSKVYHNEGISTKTGEPYENYKCSNKSCGWIQWIDLKGKNVKPLPKPTFQSKKTEPDWDKIRAEKNESIAWLNAKNCSALIVSSLIKESDKLAWNDEIIMSRFIGLADKIYRVAPNNGDEA